MAQTFSGAYGGLRDSADGAEQQSSWVEPIPSKYQLAGGGHSGLQQPTPVQHQPHAANKRVVYTSQQATRSSFLQQPGGVGNPDCSGAVMPHVAGQLAPDGSHQQQQQIGQQLDRFGVIPILPSSSQSIEPSLRGSVTIRIASP
jgi:hypothetical protein